jgi:hypothetical protein
VHKQNKTRERDLGTESDTSARSQPVTRHKHERRHTAEDYSQIVVCSPTAHSTYASFSLHSTLQLFPGDTAPSGCASTATSDFTNVGRSVTMSVTSTGDGSAAGVTGISAKENCGLASTAGVINGMSSSESAARAADGVGGITGRAAEPIAARNNRVQHATHRVQPNSFSRKHSQGTRNDTKSTDRFCRNPRQVHWRSHQS